MRAPVPETTPAPERGRRLQLILWALVALGVLAGCGREFEPYWRVNTLRVLAIQADPITVKQGQYANLSALVVSPDGEEVSYQWDWCPIRTSAQDRYECPITAEDIARWGAEGDQSREGQPPFDPSMISFDLGTEPTARLINPLAPEDLLGFCEAIFDQLANAPANSELAGLLPTVDCTRGFDVSVRLIVTAGDQEVVTSKRVTLWTGSDQVNANPAVDAIQIRPVSMTKAHQYADQLPWLPAVDAPEEEGWHTLSAEEPTPWIPGLDLRIRAIVDRDTIEVWQPPAPKGSDEEFLPPEKEVLAYRWFTTLGSLDDSRRLYRDGLNDLETASETILTLAGDTVRQCLADTDGACPVQLWGVVRDGRLGVGWAEGRLVLIEAP